MKAFIVADLQREMATVIMRCNDIRSRLITTQRQIETQRKRIDNLTRRVDAQAKRIGRLSGARTPGPDYLTAAEDEALT